MYHRHENPQEGLLLCRVLGPALGIDSVSLGITLEFAFLTTSQGTLIQWVWGVYFKNHCCRKFL